MYLMFAFIKKHSNTELARKQDKFAIKFTDKFAIKKLCKISRPML